MDQRQQQQRKVSEEHKCETGRCVPAQLTQRKWMRIGCAAPVVRASLAPHPSEAAVRRTPLHLQRCDVDLPRQSTQFVAARRCDASLARLCPRRGFTAAGGDELMEAPASKFAQKLWNHLLSVRAYDDDEAKKIVV
ncbi:hypothetical protein F2P81_023143 [Scophthalmus maximus]|uniref:Uncharacterized protein n=1 Tax=Scophthalmus maximus TaxID=52904 RepID=A0A6A4RZC2_SCOMX|nr:hypothetical protein F2P81_023143 [Scophthalmus maximus]